MSATTYHVHVHLRAVDKGVLAKHPAGAHAQAHGLDPPPLGNDARVVAGHKAGDEVCRRRGQPEGAHLGAQQSKHRFARTVVKAVAGTNAVLAAIVRVLLPDELPVVAWYFTTGVVVREALDKPGGVDTERC